MKRTAACVSILLLFLTLSVFAQLPPLIDRELFFDDPEISIGQISPDGQYISFVKPFKNVRNIWVKGRNDAFDKAWPITADTTRPVTAYFWSHDSRYILYVQDKGGDENYRVYAVDPRVPGDPVPPPRDLTPYEKVRARIFSVPLKHPDFIIVGLNDRRADLHDVYRVSINTGERTLIRKNDENVYSWFFDLDANLRLAVRQTQEGGTEILQVQGDSLKPIYTVSAYEAAGPLRFTPDGKKFYMVTNKGEKVDKVQLELFDLETGKTSFIEKDPLDQVDFATALFSDLTDELLATFYYGDRVRVYPRQKQFKETYERMWKALPDGEISISGSTADETVWVVSVSSDVDPGSRYLFDSKTGKAELLYRSRPNFPTEHLAPMKPVRYKARDGLTIPAYLTLPKGVPPKNLPVVMYIHGGPWARDIWGYDGGAQFLANRGYAVFQLNFRGSSGYGKKFLNAGNMQWGTGSMQHDISDGVQYLIKEGIADPKRVGIYGGSYGGYATLAGLTFTPDLYAAGVSFVGPSNIITLIKSFPAYWGPFMKIWYVRVGDPGIPEDAKRLEEQSPLNYAKNIRVPLLVIQGANDPRVKKPESDQIVVAVRDQGKPVEYLVAPDEGHGFAGRENRLAFFTAQEKFLAKHLGGRYQESVRPEIQAKLDALTVDVNTVTMPAPPPEVAPPRMMPNFNSAVVKPITTKYSAKFTMGGREIQISRTRAVLEAMWDGKKVWRVVEESTGGMGSSADTLDLDARTLLPIRRSTQQGPATLMMVFKEKAVEGKIKAGPQEMPINVALEAPVLAEGAGTELPVCTLPLKEGYTATLSVVNAMQAKVRPMSLKVVGKEKVTTPAGSFETYKVEITPADGEGGLILWISQLEPRVVKSETKLPPQMGGLTIVSELTN